MAAGQVRAAGEMAGGQLCGVQRVGGPGLWGCGDQSGPHQVIGALAMKCAPRAGWALVEFGVAISLFLALLALANSTLKIYGFLGSK